MRLSDLQILTFTIVAAAAIVIILLERIFPYNKDNKLFRDGIFIDFVFYNGLQKFMKSILLWIGIFLPGELFKTTTICIQKIS